MRPLVAPAPASHCNHCGGELLLKQVELADRVFERQSQTFVCVTCRRERTFAVRADPYVAAAPNRAEIASLIDGLKLVKGVGQLPDATPFVSVQCPGWRRPFDEVAPSDSNSRDSA